MIALLSLETSGPSSGVALNVDGQTVFAEDIQSGAVHGKALAPQIEKALASAKLAPNQLSAIAVSIGPGSWTGLRIGLSAAKAMAWGLSIPLLPVPTFEALAFGAVNEGAVLCVRDARSEGCFAGFFRETSSGLERWIQECVLQPGDLVAQASAKAGTTRVGLCGDDVSVKAVLAAAVAKGLDWSTLPDRQQVRASDLSAVAWRRFKAGVGLLHTAAEIHASAPMYLRASGPELKLARAQSAQGQGSKI